MHICIYETRACAPIKYLWMPHSAGTHTHRQQTWVERRLQQTRTSSHYPRWTHTCHSNTFWINQLSCFSSQPPSPSPRRIHFFVQFHSSSVWARPLTTSVETEVQNDVKLYHVFARIYNIFIYFRMLCSILSCVTRRWRRRSQATDTRMNDFHSWSS